jgi:hypothetical protein
MVNASMSERVSKSKDILSGKAALFAASLACVLAAPTAVSAETNQINVGEAKATVLNNGNNAGTCAVDAFGGQYSSEAGGVQTLVFQAGELVKLQCTSKLIGGTAVSATEVIQSGNCNLVVNPGGTAVLSCTKAR